MISQFSLNVNGLFLLRKLVLLQIALIPTISLSVTYLILALNPGRCVLSSGQLDVVQQGKQKQ